VEQLLEGGEIKSKLLGLEIQIGEMRHMLDSQRGVAAKAQRELALVKGKLLDAEAHRDHLKKDMNLLTGSGGSGGAGDGCTADERLLSREQDQLQLEELIRRREEMEKQAAILTAAKYEVDSDVSRLESTIVCIEEASDALRTKTNESEAKLLVLQTKRLQFENNAEVERVNLAECMALSAEEEQEESIILEKIEESIEKKKEINAALLQAFTSCGLKSSSKKDSAYLEPLTIQNDITRELLKAEKAMLEWVGREIFESMVLEPQRYLKEARATLVEAREKVWKL
jgi:hypothetical protein